MASSNERKLFRVSVICILIIAVIASMIISLIWGSTPVSLAEIWHTLWSSELTDTSSQIIWNIRLPRNIVAALVGACLAVSGAILQAVMKNPLADTTNCRGILWCRTSWCYHIYFVSWV